MNKDFAVSIDKQHFCRFVPKHQLLSKRMTRSVFFSLRLGDEFRDAIKVYPVLMSCAGMWGALPTVEFQSLDLPIN